MNGTLYQQDGKNYFLLNDTEIYYKNLEITYNHIVNDIQASFLYFAYVTLCASTLEASLNQIIFAFYIDKFGPNSYKKYSESLINMGFSNKLHTIPNIVSNSKFCIDTNCFTIKKLDELIVLRNRILHKKPMLRETDYDLNNIETGMEVTFKHDNYIEKIDKSHCLHFHKAIMNFKKDFVNPFFDKTLSPNGLIMAV
ncbi:hypothetical protein [Flavobacterium subsaxonicum]|uniref:Cthe-2314-like HEPN domain-containing protein n=1 Tax=Flavobacterium subsaxonicum WB 4.1-42 = DSM 21790 TaxID=1121898 RepID=A0A0A2MSP5_9FLAO|nr:hypothetical protein [Flavobacterium subsaxonicum]KGO91245.1 hypothetical protein Q766_18995 [Flavobacterium subsaxonicum WB 4.1-42 = DSM 21790]